VFYTDGGTESYDSEATSSESNAFANVEERRGLPAKDIVAQIAESDIISVG